MARWRLADAGTAALVFVGMALFVAAVYGVVVRGGAALAGEPDRPPILLSVLATAIVALGLEPVRHRLRRAATKLTGRTRVAPYDLLIGFSTDAVPARMAQLLVEATGARAAEVLLYVNGALTPVAAWPPGATPTGNRRTLVVRHGGETLGELAISIGTPLSPVEEKLFAGLAAQAGLALRAVARRAELAERLRDSTRRAQELRASRERVVAAQDEERRRLERDIHDGAQQHLVALAVQLRLAGTLVARSSPRAPGVVSGLRTAAADAIATLADLSRGIYPAQLAEGGVGPALAAGGAARDGSGGAPAYLAIDDLGRLPPELESALYFCALEALQNAAKHASGSRVRVRAGRVTGGAVELVVSDDGPGFAPGIVGGGRGLANMADRAEAVGGELSIVSRPGAGTAVTVRVPVGSGG